MTFWEYLVPVILVVLVCGGILLIRFIRRSKGQDSSSTIAIGAGILLIILFGTSISTIYESSSEAKFAWLFLALAAVALLFYYIFSYRQQKKKQDTYLSLISRIMGIVDALDLMEAPFGCTNWEMKRHVRQVFEGVYYQPDNRIHFTSSDGISCSASPDESMQFVLICLLSYAEAYDLADLTAFCRARLGAARVMDAHRH